MDELRRRMQNGSMMVLFAVLLPIFVFFVAVVVDLARAQAHKSYLQNVADAAALAGINTIEHTGMARVVPNCPNDTTLVNDKKDEADLEAGNSIKSNSKKENPLTGLETELRLMGTEEVGSYYYRVKIVEHIPLLIARAFLPDSILPEGIPVNAEAWVAVNHMSDVVENNTYSKLDKVGNEQIIKDFKTLKGAIGKDKGNSRVESVYTNRDKTLPKGQAYSISGSDISRTETVNVKSASTWKYLFVEFQPDIKIAESKVSSSTDGKKYFPFDTWDIGLDLTSDQWKLIQYTGLSGIEGNSRTSAIKNLKDKGLTETQANALLDTVIENVVTFSEPSLVRGGIETIEYNTEQGIKARRKALADWEDHGSFKVNLKEQEAEIAKKTGNTALADLVVRSATGHISAADPLLVKIESEDINKNPSETSPDFFFASSTRKVTIKIDADNTAKEYRPLIIYYYGPEDIDGNTSDMGGKRESRMVTLELNADFKGILFAPNSPVTIKRTDKNGVSHTIRGLVIAKSYCYEDETPITSNGSIYSKFGFDSSDLTFDDFDMLDLSGGIHTASDVIITSEQAKRIK